MKSALNLFFLMMLFLVLPATPASSQSYDWRDQVPRPIVVDPRTGPYDGTLEHTLDGNRFFVDRFVARAYSQIYAPWPSQPTFAYPSQQYVGQPYPYPSWYAQGGYPYGPGYPTGCGYDPCDGYSAYGNRYQQPGFGISVGWQNRSGGGGQVSIWGSSSRRNHGYMRRNRPMYRGGNLGGYAQPRQVPNYGHTRDGREDRPHRRDGEHRWRR